MRAPAFILPFALATLAGSAPALAQLSGSVGSSNATNQSFQLQNQIRGIQQQQIFQGNETRMQIQRERLYNAPRADDGLTIRRRR